MTAVAEDERAFMAAVEAMVEAAPGLTPLHAGVLTALGAGVAGDSRSFAKVFGLAHALVLRAVSDLADELGLVSVAARDARTQRAKLALTEAGRRLVAAAPAAARQG
ncbi:hypothetical protein [Methylopila turkensis]|uniref:Uncharacterized protein n=1 Tax=Methylopila turkensis TaxID=1437816 RepID=A0A9W6JNJ3_9HYPH|nr:hypothetical protein [Methylopila turkensis]GLK78979.1 hypothetical protein GCM10008174_07200 [Methylopila turkensis]